MSPSTSASLAAREPITVRGARVHNLKGVDVEIPAARLVVVTGVSGSGKSSLAFDTLYAEGQRRYVESLSAYARQFLERMEKPDVDVIEGVCPAVAIQQKAPPRSSRSTVGTATELHDYFRLLWARAGTTFCPGCGEPVQADSPGGAVERLLAEEAGRRAEILYPFHVPEDVEEGAQRLAGLLQEGFRRLRLAGDEGEVRELSLRRVEGAAEELKGAEAEVVVDRIRVEPDRRERLLDSMEIAFGEGAGRARVRVLAAASESAPDGDAAEGAPDGDAAEGAPDASGSEDAPHGDGPEEAPNGDVSGGATSGDRPREIAFDRRFRCARCDRDFLRPEPRLFSFNNPYGACPECKGFGNIIEIDLNKVVPDRTRTLEENAIEPWEKSSRQRWRRRLAGFCEERDIPMDVPWQDLSASQRRAVFDGGDGFGGVRGFFERLRKKKYKLHVRVLLSRYRGYVPCPECEGTRLRPEARHVLVGGRTLPEVVAMSIDGAERFFRELDLEGVRAAVGERLLTEIRSRLTYLVDVGLGYLTLDRQTGTLSGGEAQRINLATCLGSALVGSLYVLDEPSIGLHPRDNERLIGILKRLRDLGNTVLVVEHDREMIEVADHVIDLGPGAGAGGGEVVFTGSPEELSESGECLTAAYLRGDKTVPTPPRVRAPRDWLEVVGAAEHNLKGIDVRFPLGVLCCVTGVSGSGKSTLVHDVLYGGLRQRMGPWKHEVGEHDRLVGADEIDDVVLVDQSPIGRTPRSNPVTYVKAFDGIRAAFAGTRMARTRDYSQGHFSFNVTGGRCDACEGTGEVVVEMQFLPDVSLACEECGGTRYRREILDVEYRDRNIHEVLQMTVSEARRFFSDIEAVARRLQVLEDVGLGYLCLGQPSTTLSGGEAQRLKLASHLIQGSGDRALYLFDEPTTGLHFDDVSKLLFALNRLIDAGASVIVIEHNLEFLRTADWIIDLGPEGGEDGGWLVAQGTPEEVARVEVSHTGHYLDRVLP